MSSAETTKEARILRAVKLTLTNVIKDTATQPGMRHPLSDTTIEDMRMCLILISEREQELVAAAGQTSGMRPRYADEPPTPGKAEVSITSLKTRKPAS